MRTLFEYLGLGRLPTYLATIRRVLRPGGLFPNHGITHDAEGLKKTAGTEFIHRYAFADGELDCVSNASTRSAPDLDPCQYVSRA